MGKTHSDDNYIQNGLVFHLDGADATETEWVDRIGGAVFELFNAAIDNGGVRFNGVISSYGRYLGIVDVLWDVGTIECVLYTVNYNNYYYIFSQKNDKICYICYLGWRYSWRVITIRCSGLEYC